VGQGDANVLCGVDELHVFALCFITVLASELGDKTQLAILALSLRGDKAQVLAGSILAFSVVNGLSSALGFLLYKLLPLKVLRVAAGATFILAGIVGLIKGRGEAGRAVGEPIQPERSPFIDSLALVGLAELGDKTQLATVGFSATTGLAFVVALAAISALSLMAAATCLLGSQLAGKIGGSRANLISYVMFVVVGIAMLLWPL